MKKIKPYLIVLSVVLCVANLVYLFFIQIQISNVSTEIKSLKSSYNEMTKHPSFDDKIEMLDEDPFNPDPYTLHDILDEIEDAKWE